LILIFHYLITAANSEALRFEDPIAFIEVVLPVGLAKTKSAAPRDIVELLVEPRKFMQK